jgi:hypothetical protein
MNRAARLTLLFVLVLVSLGETGCKKRNRAIETPEGTIQPVPETRSETGWPLYEVRNEGFALALPQGWRRFDMNPSTFDQSMREALKANPELEPMLGNLRQQIASGLKFFGFDESGPKTDFVTNVNVLRSPLPPGTTREALVALSVQQLEGLATVQKPVVRDRMTAAAGECDRLRYKLNIRTPKGENRAIAFTMFVFSTNSDTYTVTLTTTADREAQLAPTFDKIGQSFRYIK